MKVAQHKWLVLEKAILSDMDCPCSPKLDLSNKKALIVHNSFEQDEYLNDFISTNERH